MTNNLEGARCVGEWEVFDSTDRADHQIAAILCADCPAIVACRQLLESQNDNKHHRPVGTWAGVLVGVTKGMEPVDCGTERGYQRHRHQGEDCAPCREAHRTHEREQARIRRARKVAA